MVIALATVEESVRAYLRDKRFPWDFDFFLSLFSKGTRVLRIRCFRATPSAQLRMKTGKKLSKAELIWFQVITLGVMGSSTLHFPCVAPQLGDSLDPLLVSHGKKLYEIVMCTISNPRCVISLLWKWSFFVNENERIFVIWVVLFIPMPAYWFSTFFPLWLAPYLSYLWRGFSSMVCIPLYLLSSTHYSWLKRHYSVVVPIHSEYSNHTSP